MKKKTQLKYYKYYLFSNPPLVRDSENDPWLLLDGTIYDPKTYVEDNNVPCCDELTGEINIGNKKRSK